jgi:hypothetical protein
MVDSVNSQVPEIKLNEHDDVEVTVQLAGFPAEKSIDVYGYITQNSGAFGGFRETRRVPAADDKGVAKITLTIPAEKLKLTAGEPVTVVTWVSEVWPSMLTPDLPNETSGGKPSWTINQAVSDNWRLAHAAGAEPSGSNSSGKTARTRLPGRIQPAGQSPGLYPDVTEQSISASRVWTCGHTHQVNVQHAVN